MTQLSVEQERAWLESLKQQAAEWRARSQQTATSSASNVSVQFSPSLRHREHQRTVTTPVHKESAAEKQRRSHLEKIRLSREALMEKAARHPAIRVQIPEVEKIFRLSQQEFFQILREVLQDKNGTNPSNEQLVAMTREIVQHFQQ